MINKIDKPLAILNKKKKKKEKIQITNIRNKRRYHCTPHKD